MKRLFPLILSILLLATLILTACDAVPTVAVSQLPQLKNGLEGGTVSFHHVIDGGNVAFDTAFSTDYNTNNWRVTDSKTLNFSGTAKPAKPDVLVDVLVEHVHIDVSIKSTQPGFDGWKTDTADFKLATGNEAGVTSSVKYPYVNVMDIEGFSQTLISGWGYFTDSWGYTSTDQKRLTEDNLVSEGGVYAQKIQIVWFLLVKYQGETNYHSQVVSDEFIVPVGNLLKQTPTPRPQ